MKSARVCSCQKRIDELETALGKLGHAANVVSKELFIVQPFFAVFIKHGKIINECMDKVEKNKLKESVK